LFFPVTPFDAADRVDTDVLERHVRARLAAGPGAVFAACGTGEFHALSAGEHRQAVERVVEVVDRSVPVVAGAGGPLGHARDCARAASDVGADGLLLMPPYLVAGAQDGLVAYVEAVAAETDLDVIVYHRGNAAFTPESAERLFRNPKVVGLKDGVGDVAAAQRFATAAARADREISLFNGLLTAELSQAAYDGIGIELYSSAVFTMAPDIATAYVTARRRGDAGMRRRLLETFYEPFVGMRDECPGFAVSLIKAGVRLDGLEVGSVRPPLTDPTAEQVERLRQIITRGRAIL
jgi:5-dehydro-4-deoxyglucarate dehydratase